MKSFQISITYSLRTIYICIITSCVLFLQGRSILMSQSVEKSFEIEPPVSTNVIYESRERQDLLDENSPKGLRVVQITTDPNLVSHNVYMESHIFTPDSRRFIFVRQGNRWLCDIEDNFSLIQITDEEGTSSSFRRGAAVSPDGKWMYYIVDETLSAEGRFKLKRVSLENFTRETLLTIAGAVPGTNYTPTRFYGYTSLSSDGRRLCAYAFLGDGKTENAPFGILVFDLENPSVKIIFKGKEFCNMHLQYCRSLDPVLSHDILIQHNHGSTYDLTGKRIKLGGGKGADIHVIRDDGTNWRDVPIGRDGISFCQGHQAWRGRTGSVLSSMTIRSGKRRGQSPILLALPIPTDETTSHLGFNVPDGKYIDITRNIDYPDFDHFCSDISGMHLVSDTYSIDKKTKERIMKLVIGTLNPGENPELKAQYLLNTKTSGNNPAHPHPFFSPDTRMIFFNSDESGQTQIYMVTGYKFPEF